jgi:hypothetical protein
MVGMHVMALSYRPQTMAGMCDRVLPDRPLMRPDVLLGEQDLNCLANSHHKGLGALGGW